MGRIGEFITNIRKFDPHKAKIHHAELMVKCAMLDTNVPFGNNLMIAFRTPTHGGITVTIQKDKGKSPGEQAVESKREIDDLVAALDAMRFAYVNCDHEDPHDFEESAYRKATELLERHERTWVTWDDVKNSRWRVHE